MHPVRRRKILVILIVLAACSVALALVLYALRQNISLFYTPTEVATGKAPLRQKIRVGGMVQKGSVVRDKKSLKVSFDITDYEKTIHITYVGILPDLFRDEQGVVVSGAVVDNMHVTAETVFAKHDENYMPPEVKASLKKKKVL